MNSNAAPVLSLTIVTSAYGSGQRIASVAVEYSEPIARDMVKPEFYEIPGFQITSLCVSDSVRGAPIWEGHFVQLLIDGELDSLSLCEHVGSGQASRIHLKHPELTVIQKEQIPLLSGKTAEAFSMKATAVDYGIADRFSSFAFAAKNGKQLNYNLYVP